MKDVFVLVLNFNDAQDTMRIVGEVSDFDCVRKTIIVDNCSTDNSFQIISSGITSIKSDKAELIVADCNDGYASGNNIGLRYIENISKDCYVLIANPDTYFDENTLISLCEVLDNNDEIGIVGCRQSDIHGRQSARSFWDRPSFWYDFRSLFFLGRKINDLFFPAHSLNRGDGLFVVGAVSGSLFMARMKALTSVDFFDEGTFLYCEETILAERMAAQNYCVAYLSSSEYTHAHAVSTSSYLGLARSMRILQKSKLYYHKVYHSISPLKVAVFSMGSFVSNLEFSFMHHLKQILNKRPWRTIGHGTAD